MDDGGNKLTKQIQRDGTVASGQNGKQLRRISAEIDGQSVRDAVVKVSGVTLVNLLNVFAQILPVVRVLEKDVTRDR